MQKQVIEYKGQPVGIVVPEQGSLRFIAVKFDVIDLDAKIFQSAQDVREAIRSHLESRNPLHA